MSVRAFTLAVCLLGVTPASLCAGTAWADEAQSAASTILRGLVTIKGRVDLPANAQLAVMLDDVSLADAPSITLSKTVFAPVGTQSFGYALSYDPTAFRPGHRYALRAEIRADGRLLYISKEAIMGTGTVPAEGTIVVEPVTIPLPTALVGNWKIDAVGEKPTSAEAPAFTVFRADGFLSGTGGCNRMMGHVSATGQSFTFGPIAGTRMACPGIRMTQEDAVFAAASQVKSWRMAQDRLLLDDAQGGTVLTLSRNETGGHAAKTQTKHTRVRKSQ